MKKPKGPKPQNEQCFGPVFWGILWEFPYVMCFFFLCLFLSSAGCTFDEDSDPSLCEFSQGEEDDFDWQLFRAHASPHSTSDLLRGESPHRYPFVFQQFISHCVAKPFHTAAPFVLDALLLAPLQWQLEHQPTSQHML